jgi:hypothetical protein
VTFVGKFADWKRLDAVLYAAKEYEAPWVSSDLLTTMFTHFTDYDYENSMGILFFTHFTLSIPHCVDICEHGRLHCKKDATQETQIRSPYYCKKDLKLTLMVGEKIACWRLQNDQWPQVPQNRFGHGRPCQKNELRNPQQVRQISRKWLHNSHSFWIPFGNLT